MGGACQEESAVGASGTRWEPRSRAGSRQRQLGSTVLHAADWFQLSHLINKMDAQRCPVWSSVGSKHENVLSEGHVANVSSTHVPTRLEVSWTSTRTLPACPVGSRETRKCCCGSVGGRGTLEQRHLVDVCQTKEVPTSSWVHCRSGSPAGPGPGPETSFCTRTSL